MNELYELLNVSLEEFINKNYISELKELKLLDELYMLNSEYNHLKSLKLDLLTQKLLSYDAILYSILKNEYCTSVQEWHDLNADEKNFLMEEVEQCLSDEILNIVEQ